MAISITAPALLILLIVIACMVCLHGYRKIKNRMRGDIVRTATNNRNRSGGETPVTTQQVERIQLSPEDRIELYNVTFDANGNQLVLEEKHVVKKKRNKNCENDDEKNAREEGAENGNYNNDSYDLENMVADLRSGDADLEEDDDSTFTTSTILKLESKLINRKKDVADIGKCNDDEQKEKLTNAIKEGSNRGTTTPSTTSSSGAATTVLIDGTCAICFEPYAVGETIVWSENTSCRHLYHKKCVVKYLARHAIALGGEGRLDVTNNPCPACRRNYCSVRVEDLVNLMLKSVSRRTTSTLYLNRIPTITASVDVSNTAIAEAVISATTSPSSRTTATTNNLNNNDNNSDDTGP